MCKNGWDIVKNGFDEPHDDGEQQQTEQHGARGDYARKVRQLTLSYGAPVEHKADQAPDREHQKGLSVHCLDRSDL